MVLKVVLESELEHEFRAAAMKRYGYIKGSLQKATKEALKSWIRQESNPSPTIPDPFPLVEGILHKIKGKKTSVELQHEVTKVWAKKFS